jgi:hypothetical protein
VTGVGRLPPATRHTCSFQRGRDFLVGFSFDEFTVDGGENVAFNHTVRRGLVLCAERNAAGGGGEIALIPTHHDSANDELASVLVPFEREPGRSVRGKRDLFHV